MESRVVWCVTATLVLAIVGGFANQVVIADECCSSQGCRIKFLDDLTLLGGSGQRRNPREERIETDRHDFTQSTKTVGRGVFQVESGYSYFYKDENEEIEGSHTAPEMLLRLGLTDNIEFRLRYSYVWQFIDEEEDRRGSQDLIWTFKLGITDQEQWIPESALELRFTAPTGGSEYSTRRVDHGLDYIYGWEVSERSELYGSTGYATGGLDDFGLVPENPSEDWFVVFTQSIALGTELTERMTVYNEFFGIFSHAREDDFSIVFYNIGVDYYLSDDFVLDVRAGKGLTPEADDFFAGIGGGYRF